MRAALIGLKLALAPLVLLPVSLPAKEAVQALPLAGEAERTGDKVTLRWTGLSGPVRISRLDRADAKRGTILIRRAEGREATVTAAASPRPYFLLRDSAGRELRLAERLLPLEGGMNFRDLGGYSTADGQSVVWGKIYRSAVMSGLTANDYRYLGNLGIGAICDFRASDERTREPMTWPQGSAVKLLVRDYKLDMSQLMTMFRGGDITPEKARDGMAGFYTELPFGFAGQFKEMFAELVKGEAPLAFNCSAGKDRTGVAAVLILSALGVPRETAITDYLLSNRYYKPKAPAPGTTPDPTMAMFAQLPAGVAQALMGVERRYIEASFAAIDARGGMDRYLREDMGLTDADRARLRSLYLTK